MIDLILSVGLLMIVFSNIAQAVLIRRLYGLQWALLTRLQQIQHKGDKGDGEQQRVNDNATEHSEQEQNNDD